jgi:hypothetical protein
MPMNEHSDNSRDRYADDRDVPYTGHDRVDDVLASLAHVAGAPPADQIPALTEAQQTLTETLDSIGDV